MAERLLNHFLLGADPEMILLDPPQLVNGQRTVRDKGLHPSGFYGFDHGGFVLEPHPTPHRSAREVCHNIKKSLNVATFHMPEYKQRAGAYYRTEQRPVTLGGHVHLDIPELNAQQIAAMDLFCTNLEHLDILPTEECRVRAGDGQGYGRKGDIRAEHGHVEYRSMCSWLFSRRTSMLCITGIKLAAIAPDTIGRVTSNKSFVAWLEAFKGKDDDVDWILDNDYFSKSMVAKPDASITEVWKVKPKEGEKLAALFKAVNRPLNEINRVRNPLLMAELRARIVDFEEQRRLRLQRGMSIAMVTTQLDAARMALRVAVARAEEPIALPVDDVEGELDALDAAPFDDEDDD